MVESIHLCTHASKWNREQFNCAYIFGKVIFLSKLSNRIKSWLRLHDAVTIGLRDACDPCQHGSGALWALCPLGHCGEWWTFVFGDESQHLPLPSMDSSVEMTPLHEDKLLTFNNKQWVNNLQHFRKVLLLLLDLLAHYLCLWCSPIKAAFRAWFKTQGRGGWSPPSEELWAYI